MKKLQTLIFIITVMIGITAFCILPDNIAVQWNADGASNYLPKIATVPVSVAVSIFGIISWKYSAVRYRQYIEASKIIKTFHISAFSIISCMGIILNAIFMIMN